MLYCTVVFACLILVSVAITMCLFFIMMNIAFFFLQTELISGDQNGNIRVWDLRANSCSCELVIFNPSLVTFPKE